MTRKTKTPTDTTVKKGTRVWISGMTWAAAGVVTCIDAYDGFPWIEITEGPRKGEAWHSGDLESVTPMPIPASRRSR